MHQKEHLLRKQTPELRSEGNWGLAGLGEQRELCRQEDSHILEQCTAVKGVTPRCQHYSEEPWQHSERLYAVCPFP